MNSDFLISDEDELETILGESLEFVRDKVQPALDDAMCEYIRRSPLIFISTIDEAGRADCSPKGDPRGFVQVDEDGNLLIPERPGNRLTFGFRNILRNQQIGLIFVVPGMRETLRVKGKATLHNDPSLLLQLAEKGKPALLCTCVEVEECFFHCGKAMIRSKMWQPDSWETHTESLMIRQFADKLNADKDLETLISSEIEKNYEKELY
jgi:PPOX class probable FMN-dependent enzyme